MDVQAIYDNIELYNWKQLHHILGTHVVLHCLLHVVVSQKIIWGKHVPPPKVIDYWKEVMSRAGRIHLSIYQQNNSLELNRIGLNSVN